MSLREFVESVAANRRTITAFAPEPAEALADHFEARGVTVAHEPLPDDGSGGFVVVTADGEFVGSVPLRVARRIVAPEAADLDAGAGDRAAGEPDRDGLSSTRRRLPMNLLADTTFVSFDRRQLLAASREIEDRAYRQAQGTLRAGFQSLSRVADQQRVYEDLVERQNLDVHLYGTPDGDSDRDWHSRLTATVHAEDDPEIAGFWFVVFDGGGDNMQACALLAEEVTGEPGSFRGFWTYDPETVANLDAYLAETF